MTYKFNKNGESVITVIVENENCEYTIDNLKDIFGRCEGEQVDFDFIDQVFDAIWQSGEVITFDELSSRMYPRD
jgi:uncharacterized protein YkuJ